jgi:hypothetical protein
MCYHSTCQRITVARAVGSHWLDCLLAYLTPLRPGLAPVSCSVAWPLSRLPLDSLALSCLLTLRQSMAAPDSHPVSCLINFSHSLFCLDLHPSVACSLWLPLYYPWTCPMQSPAPLVFGLWCLWTRIHPGACATPHVPVPSIC